MEHLDQFLKRENKQSHYDKRLILEVVKLVEEGMPRKEANRLYNLGASTLDSWMRNYGSQGYQERKRRKTTPLEKRKIIADIVQGRLTESEARKRYNIKSVRTISNWLYQWRLGNSTFSPPIDSQMDNNKQKSIFGNTSNHALQKALDDAQLKIEALNTMIDVAETQLNIDIRKKSGTKQ